MAIPRICCPKCNSEETRKVNGPYHVSAVLYQQRYYCSICGQKFLASWQCSGLRTYEPRSTAELLQAGA